MTKRTKWNTENVDACFGSALHKKECKTAMPRKSQIENHAVNVKLSSLSEETVADRTKIQK